MAGSLWTNPVKPRFPNSVIVECPRCHRPLGILEDAGPGKAHFMSNEITTAGPVGECRRVGRFTSHL
jgi:hypothetical protein